MATKAEREALKATEAETAALNAATHTPPTNREENVELLGDAPPVYETDAEIAAARGMYGHSYDKLIEQGNIIAPTSEELAGRSDDAATKRSGAKRSGKKHR